MLLHRQQFNNCKNFNCRRRGRRRAYQVCKVYGDNHIFAAVTLAARIQHGPCAISSMAVCAENNERYKNPSKAGNFPLSW
jgi:hypothetical protein